ncbi:MAG TPA: hypothetical protein PK761_01520 [Clostridia bacterium]|nr:hypothetical protein [Clostridia bacterium]HPL07568.1 hypothetical protein [Clostridia bacterium]
MVRIDNDSAYLITSIDIMTAIHHPAYFIRDAYRDIVPKRAI